MDLTNYSFTVEMTTLSSAPGVDVELMRDGQWHLKGVCEFSGRNMIYHYLPIKIFAIHFNILSNE